MGPGYFPLMLGILLAVIGSLITFKATTWRPPTATRSASGPGSRCSSSWRPTSPFGILLGGLPSIGVPAMGLIVGIYA
jgi:hypothetical protein